MWLWPPALGALYVAARPFLASWLSVIQLFLIEGVIVVLLAGLTLWLVSPILRGTIGLFETILRPAFPSRRCSPVGACGWQAVVLSFQSPASAWSLRC